MNQKKAKQLRRSIGYHPTDKRTYDTTRRGTLIVTESRRRYQNVKRTPGMANILLRSA